MFKFLRNFRETVLFTFTNLFVSKNFQKSAMNVSRLIFEIKLVLIIVVNFSQTEYVMVCFFVKSILFSSPILLYTILLPYFLSQEDYFFLSLFLGSLVIIRFYNEDKKIS